MFLRFGLLCSLLLSGCASTEATKVHILCTSPDGKVFHAEGISGKQAQVITDEWDLDACDVKVTGRDESSQKP